MNQRLIDSCMEVSFRVSHYSALRSKHMQINFTSDVKGRSQIFSVERADSLFVNDIMLNENECIQYAHLVQK